jgi:hypothetical protein
MLKNPACRLGAELPARQHTAPDREQDDGRHEHTGYAKKWRVGTQVINRKSCKQRTDGAGHGHCQ